VCFVFHFTSFLFSFYTWKCHMVCMILVTRNSHIYYIVVIIKILHVKQYLKIQAEFPIHLISPNDQHKFRTSLT